MRDEFISKTNNSSTVIIANTSNSNIKTIMSDNEYQDRLYNLLYNRNFILNEKCSDFVLTYKCLICIIIIINPGGR